MSNEDAGEVVVRGNEKGGCPDCGGTGEIFTHADDCEDDHCALNGDMYSCVGKVEHCSCNSRHAHQVVPQVLQVTAISAEQFRAVLAALGRQGADDVQWSEALTAPADADSFAQEAIFVICNSGMKNTVARQIFNRCLGALFDGRPVLEVFRHKGKAAAIEAIWADRARLLAMYLSRETDAERLAMLAALPWIGDITKYHLAKNFGVDVAKPDVHLQRLADREGCTPQALCDRIAAEVGLRSATVDVVLWRACADGVINSRTGAIQACAALIASTRGSSGEVNNV